MKSKRIAALIAFALLAFGQLVNAQTLPAGFPFAACPGGTIVESFSQAGVSQIVEFKTSESAARVSQFYTGDIKQKGWTLVSGGMQTPSYSVLRATKGKDKVVMHISSGGRTPMTNARLVLLFNAE